VRVVNRGVVQSDDKGLAICTQGGGFYVVEGEGCAMKRGKVPREQSWTTKEVRSKRIWVQKLLGTKSDRRRQSKKLGGKKKWSHILSKQWPTAEQQKLLSVGMGPLAGI